MDNTDIRYSNGRIKKDKSSEKKDYARQTFKVPPEEATHAGEAMDTLMLGLQHEFKTGGNYDAGEPYIG